MTKAKRPESGPSYGEAAERLEAILLRIEDGEVDIDELSGLVQEAAGLVTLCREKIRSAEMQVRTITEQLERDAEEPIDGDGSESAEGDDEPAG